MAKQLFVKLQTPVIELVITATDASGKKESITGGFKRYDEKTSEGLLKTFNEVYGASQKEEELLAFVKQNVLYLKNVKLEIVEDGKTTELVVKDTREAAAVTELWTTPEECLTLLLDTFMASAPWRLEITLSVQKALYNINLEDSRLKN